jgi:hypothetical protein
VAYWTEIKLRQNNAYRFTPHSGCDEEMMEGGLTK